MDMSYSTQEDKQSENLNYLINKYKELSMKLDERLREIRTTKNHDTSKR